MKINRESGFVGVDMILSILAVLIFSGLIISLMYNNAVENIKIKRQALAIIYLTETFENIGIANYEDVTQENKANFIPTEVADKNYEMDITINEDENEQITKKITATISYKLANKKYEYSIERIKMKG